MPIPINMNGRVYITEVDELGVQRFRRNGAVTMLLDFAEEHGFGLDRLLLANSRDEISKADMQELYRLLGTSVDHYADVFHNQDIDNPLWDIEP
jgi:hypothetical protein